MKTTLSLLLLLFALECEAQKNTLYSCFQPNDLGLGLRYDRSFDKMGLYASFSSGRYRFAEHELSKLQKFSAGAMIYGKKKFCSDRVNFLSAGINYNIYGTRRLGYAYHPLGFEIGAGGQIKWFAAAFRYEVVKANVSLDFGIKF